MPREDFRGAKIALLTEGGVVVMRRDDKPEIPHPDLVEFPGGGREGRESPLGCARRETSEELSVQIPESAVFWGKSVPGTRPGQLPIWFFVARIDTALVASMVLRDEGQGFWVEPLEVFLARDDAVPHLQDRAREYCQEAMHLDPETD